MTSASTSVIDNPIRRQIVTTALGSRLKVSPIRKVRIRDMHIYRERLKDMVLGSGIMSRKPDTPDTSGGIYRPALSSGCRWTSTTRASASSSRPTAA